MDWGRPVGNARPRVGTAATRFRLRTVSPRTSTCRRPSIRSHDRGVIHLFHTPHYYWSRNKDISEAVEEVDT